MKVTGEHRTVYRLENTPIRQSYDGAVYRVSGTTQTFVKIYPVQMRTDLERIRVIEAVNGHGGIMGPRPIEAVYESGKFSGYVFQEEVEPVQPVSVSVPVQSTPLWLPLLITAVFGMIGSLVIRFVIMRILRNSTSDLCYAMLNQGVIMMAGGFIAGLVGAVVSYQRMDGVLDLLVGPLCFIVGAFIVFVATSFLAVLVTAITMGLSIAAQLMPSIVGAVVMIAVLVYIVKILIK